MTFELNIKCIWHYTASKNYLEITKIEWSETDQPVVITVNSLRQLQPGIWKLPIKQGSQELTNLLAALLEYSVSSRSNNTHPLTIYLVKEILKNCQPLVAGDQGTKPEQLKAS